MESLPGRPALDPFARDLRPLEWVWSEEDGPGVVTGRGLAVFLRDATSRPWRGCARALNPLIFKDDLLAAVAATKIEGACPVRFDWHVVERSVAPHAWRLLAVLEEWGIDLMGAGPARVAADPMVHVLWQVYLRLATVSTQRDASALGYNLGRASGALEDLGASEDPIFSALSDLLREDLEEAVRDRVRRDLAAIIDQAAPAIRRARDVVRLEDVAHRIAAKTLRVRHAFGEFPGVSSLVTATETALSEAVAARHRDMSSKIGTAGTGGRRTGTRSGSVSAGRVLPPRR